jgi:Kdo2-lipid IVA lauroyltransferase/acyltransferase
MTHGWEKLTYQLIRILARWVGRMPPQRGLRTGKRLGRRLFRWHGRYRDIALENLRKAYPEKGEMEICDIAERVFENLGKLFYEVCRSTALSDDDYSRLVTIEGRHHIEDAYARGRGVLLLTAHFGNWEYLTAMIPHFGRPISIVYRPLDFKPLEHFIVSLRTRFGASMIAKKKGFRKVLGSLQRKEMAALLMDQNVAWREGVFAPFFNRPACTNKGLALLALKTGAPVVPVFLLREADGYRGIIQAEIPLIRTGDRTKDVETNTAAYNRAIEAMVRRYPDQWFWVHRRWNTKPFCPWPRNHQ